MLYSKNYEKALSRYFEKSPFKWRIIIDDNPDARYSSYRHLAVPGVITVAFYASADDTMTPWMLAHRIGHAIEQGYPPAIADVKSDFTEACWVFLGRVRDRGTDALKTIGEQVTRKVWGFGYNVRGDELLEEAANDRSATRSLLISTQALLGRYIGQPFGERLYPDAPFDSSPATRSLVKTVVWHDDEIPWICYFMLTMKSARDQQDRLKKEHSLRYEDKPKSPLVSAREAFYELIAQHIVNGKATLLGPDGKSMTGKEHDLNSTIHRILKELVGTVISDGF